MTGYYNFLNSKVTINGELNKIGEQIDSLTIELHQTKNILQSKEKDHLDLIKKFVALREENEALKQENEKPERYSKWVKTECYYGTLYEFKQEKLKERKLVCKQKKCRFYHNCDNYNCSYLEPVDNLTESEVRE